MNLNININLEAVLAGAISKALAPETIAATVEKMVADTVNNVLRDELRQYSDFGKQLQETVKQAVPHGFGEDHRAKFIDALQKAIAASVARYQDEAIAEAAQQAVAKVLGGEPVPQVLKLSELAAKAVELWGDVEHRTAGSSAPTIIAESGDMGGYWHVFIDPQEGKGKYSCRVQFGVTPDGEIYALRVAEQETKRAFYLGSLYDFDRYIFALYTGGTKLEIDQTDFYDLHYPGSDCDD